MSDLIESRRKKKTSTSTSSKKKNRRPLPLPSPAPRALSASARRATGPASSGASAAAPRRPRRGTGFDAGARDGTGESFRSFDFSFLFSGFSNVEKTSLSLTLSSLSLSLPNHLQGVGSSMAHRAVDAVLGSREFVRFFCLFFLSCKGREKKKPEEGKKLTFFSSPPTFSERTKKNENAKKQATRPPSRPRRQPPRSPPRPRSPAPLEQSRSSPA